MNPHSLSHLSVPLLQRMAGLQSFRRGKEYFADDRVTSLVEHNGVVSAKVRGSRTYRVELRTNDADGVDYSCNCPIGQDGEFCKHCVAVGLQLLQASTPGKTGGPRPRPMVTLDDARTYLAEQSKQSLVDLLLAQAVQDDNLRRQLLLKAAKSSNHGPDIEMYREAIDDAVSSDDFVDYRGAHDYSQRIEQAIDSVRELLKSGYAREAIDLAEHALRAVERAMHSVDDSDGVMGGILEDLQDLHLDACKQGKPDPQQLAQRLFEWEMSTDWDTFFNAAETYAEVLGKEGLAVYRRLAGRQWEKLPALKPGQESRSFEDNRFRITHIMEALARQTGDLDAVIAVKQRDLSSAYHFLQIAEAYLQARKHDQALEWAEKGVKAFPQRIDSRLREFLANEYHHRKRPDEAMALIWAGFSESPHLAQYQNLRTHANRSDTWAQWRDKALAFIRETIAASGKQRSHSQLHRHTDHSLLVQIFLWEKDVDAAWREAQTGGCSDALWMELAKKREKQHPADALPIYRKQIEPTLSLKNNDAYARAVALLLKIRALMLDLQQKDEFARYLQALRVAHKPKRNFIKLLDAKTW